MIELANALTSTSSVESQPFPGELPTGVIVGSAVIENIIRLQLPQGVDGMFQWHPASALCKSNHPSLFQSSAMPRLKAPQRREQLIEVATKLFARNGYEATTTAAIALAAGVTEPILYRHFKSKQDLFVAIVRAVSERTMRHWQRLIDGIADPAERIRRIAREFPEQTAQLDDAYHVLHGALATSRDRKVIAVMKEHYAQIERFFVKVVTDGQRAGAFRKDVDPRVPAWQLIMTGIGYAMVSLNLSTFDRRLIRDAIETILRGMR